MSNARGWAVEPIGGQIMINTVSGTRRAAIVNYLVTEHRVMLTIFDSDENIENLWKHYGEHAECRQVNVSTLPIG